MVIAAAIISDQGSYYSARPCGQLDFIFDGNKTATLSEFPECAPFYSGNNKDEYALVKADMDGDSGANVAAALGISFGPAIWLAFAIHAIAIEIYVCDYYSLGAMTGPHQEVL